MRRILSSEAVLSLSILFGVAVPPAAELLRPFLFVFVFFLMLFSLLAIRLSDAWSDRHLSGRLILIMSWQMLVLPAAIGAWYRFSPTAGNWSELMFITACAGTIFGAPAFARVMNLDVALTLRGVIAGTLLMPVVLPLLTPLVTQSGANFDYTAYGGRLIVFIVIPFSAAYWYQTRGPENLPGADRVFGRLTILFLVLFGIAIMDGIGPRFLANPGEMFGLLGFAFLVYVGFFGLSTLLFLRWGRRQALTAGLLSGYRNLAVVLAVGGSLLPTDFIVYAALWQIPMYLTPFAVLCCRRAGQSRQ